MKEHNNIENLLMECGCGFRSLSLHTDGRWIAKSGRKATPTNQLFTGKTPVEALQKLNRAITENAITLPPTVVK